MLKFLPLLILLSCQSEKLPVLGLKLKPVYERDLTQWVQRNTGLTYDDAPKNYPGYLKEGDQSFKGKISLRGDLRTHWKGDKKSFRFKAEKDTYFHKFKEVDFLIPNDKVFEAEPFGYEVARSFNLLVPEWKIVELVFNNRNNGPYLMLEHWSPESFERRGMPEGEIIRENNAWLDVISLKEKSRYRNVFYNRQEINPLAYRLEIYKTVFNRDHSTMAFSRFKDMLQAVKKNQWHDFFDMDEAVNWTVLMGLIGSYHGILGDNIKWYYHPYRKIFRPIPYDFLPERLKENTCPFEDFAKMNIWLKAWMSDEEFKSKLRLKLSEITASKWYEDSLNEFYERWDVKALDVDGKSRDRKDIFLWNKKVMSSSCL